MGIKGLKGIIKKHAKCAISESFDLNGKKIAIDSSILMYKYRYQYQSDNFHYLGFLNKIIELLSNGVYPIFVFDGKPPEAKLNVLKNRSETRKKMKEKLDVLLVEYNELNVNELNVSEFIDSGSETEESEEIVKIKNLNKEIKKIQKNLLYVHKIHSVNIMDLLKTLGIPFLESPGEAEEACAYLQKTGVVDYILTEDTDALTFGGSNIIFDNKLYDLNKILESLELNQDEFIDLCILCGCDYTEGIPKVGPVTALNIIKKHRSIENFKEENKKYVLPDSFDFITARNLFKQNNNYNLNLTVCLPDKNAMKSILTKNGSEFFIEKIINLINFNFQ
jgi:flap endonuclease-1